MTNFLVTGGAGNIASALVNALSKDKDNFIVIADNLLTGNLNKVMIHLENVKFIKCDCNDYNDIAPLFFTYRFDYVFHYAAVVGVERTLSHPLWVLRDITGIERTLKNTIITTFGRDLAVANTESDRPNSTATGRQSQTWVRLPEGWRIVSAHVSDFPGA